MYYHEFSILPNVCMRGLPENLQGNCVNVLSPDFKTFSLALIVTLYAFTCMTISYFPLCKHPIFCDQENMMRLEIKYAVKLQFYLSVMLKENNCTCNCSYSYTM